MAIRGGWRPSTAHYILSCQYEQTVFFLIRSCAQALIPRTFLPIISSRHWPDIVKEIGAMHWGRLLSFYAYMARSNAPLREQYAFHLMLYDTYPSHYRTTWWMIRQIMKVTFVICKTTMGSATSRLCASSTPTLALNDICQRMRCLVACCDSQVHIDLRDATEEHEEGNQEEQEEYQPAHESFIRETVL